LLPEPAALERTELVDHQHAVQMVVLVLDRHGEQTFGLELEGLAIDVESPHPNALGALDFFGAAWKGQTTLLVALRAGGIEDLRIDENHQIAWLFFVGDVDDEDSLEHTDLIGGEADAGSGVHGFGHV